MKAPSASESDSDSGKILVLFCEPLGGANGKAVERLKTHAIIQTGIAPTPVDAISLMLKRGMGVIVFRIQERAHFQRALSLLRAFQSGIVQGAIQFVVTTPVSNEQMGDRLRSAGVTEIIQEPVADRALAFKLERFAKNVQAFKARKAQQQKAAEKAKKGEASPQQASTAAVSASGELPTKGEGPAGASAQGGAGAASPFARGSAGSKERSGLFGRERAADADALGTSTEAGLGRAPGQQKTKLKAKTNESRWGPALQHESDIWSAADCAIKAVGDRWVIRHRGPGPGVGKWVETSGKVLERPHSDTKYFEWVWHEPEEQKFVQVPGRWIFCGIRAPEFIDEMWWFSGRRPSLFFVHEGRVQAAKFAASQEGTLIVAKDSARANALLPRFVETWKKGVKVRQKKPGVEGAEEEADATVKRAAGRESGVKGKERAKVNRFGTLIRTPSLPLESDFWTLNVEQTLAREAGTWQVALLGPSSSEAKWEESAGPSGKFWIFVPTTKKVADLHRELGDWTLSGATPRFEKGLWLFEGESPRLDFRAPGGITKGIRLNTRKDRALLVARDSRIALQLASGLKKEAKSFGYVELDSSGKQGIEFDYLDRRELKEGALLEAERGEAEAAAFNNRLKREEAAAQGGDDFIDRPEDHGLDLQDRRGADAPRKGWKRWNGSERPTRGDFEGAIRESTDAMGEALFEYPELMLGKRGGRFDFISTEVATVPATGASEREGPRVDLAAPHAKAFVFVPVEVLMGTQAEFKPNHSFWIYAGVQKPELDTARQLWIFRLERPSEIVGFGNLATHVQRYLLDLLESCRREPEVKKLPPQPVPLLREPAAAERAEDDLEDSSEENSRSEVEKEVLRREFEEPETEEGGESEGNEEVGTDSGKHGDSRAGSSRSEEAARAFGSQDSSADRSGSNEEEKNEGQARSRSRQGGLPGKEASVGSEKPGSPASKFEMLESPILALRKKRQRDHTAAVEAVLDSVAEKLPEEVRAAVAEAVAAVQKETEARPSEAPLEAKPAAVPLGNPRNPGVLPLGMALYASELLRSRGGSARALLLRFLDRWSRSLGGLSIELQRAAASGGPDWAVLVRVGSVAAGEQGVPAQEFTFESGEVRFRLLWNGEEAGQVPLEYQKQVILGLTGLLAEAEPAPAVENPQKAA